ncbi:MAG: 30S ribosomal protein S11 [Candidatus Gracilibacteria bacterium]|jgi:small subunit ribosomal protein S11
MAEEQKKTEPEKVATPVAAEGAKEVEGDKKIKAVKKKKGKKKTVLEANVNIQASYNNTIVTVTEINGDVICWASSGACGFKGTRKATPYAASVAVETALNKAKLLGVERVHISTRGTGTGRDQALRAVAASGLSIESISDRTATAHNGCRARKARRI